MNPPGVLRYSLRQENVVVIEQELECIRNYITIQKIRFGDKYDIRYEIDPSLLAFSVLRLSLQSLVENAMKHGLEARKEKCILIIRVYQDERNLYFQAEDNGIGIEADRIEVILSGGKNSSGSVALSNLISRLKLYYGEKAGLMISSVVGEGTRLKVYMEKKSIERAQKSIPPAQVVRLLHGDGPKMEYMKFLCPMSFAKMIIII